MTTLRTILAALILCAAPAQAQTLKSLMYNTTNGHIVYSGTNHLNFTLPTTFNDDVSGNAFESSSGSNSVRFDSAGIQFSGSAAATTRTNLGLGLPALTNTSVTNFRAAIGLGATNEVLFGRILGASIESTTFYVGVGSNGIEFEEPSVAATTRTNLGLGLPALTNTSNVTTMRALAGSTNTAEPFSGAIQYLDHSSNTWQMIVSNGIILDNYEQ